LIGFRAALVVNNAAGRFRFDQAANGQSDIDHAASIEGPPLAARAFFATGRRLADPPASRYQWRGPAESDLKRPDCGDGPETALIAMTRTWRNR